MLDVAIRSERTAGRENGIWLVGFPIVGLLVLMIAVQATLALVVADPLTIGVCHQTGALEARFMAMMLH